MTKSRGILTPRRAWSEADDRLLVEHYPNTPTATLAQLLGRSATQVYQRAYRLGLEKSQSYLESPAAGRLDGQRGSAQRFVKGGLAWNKGLHYQPGSRVAETQFKPGRAPEEARNYLPIGSLRLCKDGYLERKVTDDQSLVPARRWVAVHRLVWIDVNGPIPDGHAVVFRPGRKTADLERITVEALECIPRQELMRRNSVHTIYPPEVAQLVQLRGAINRQINRRAKEAETR